MQDSGKWQEGHPALSNPVVVPDFAVSLSFVRVPAQSGYPGVKGRKMFDVVVLSPGCKLLMLSCHPAARTTHLQLNSFVC